MNRIFNSIAIFLCIVILLFSIFLSNRRGFKNYKEAFVEIHNDQTFIKLRGRRQQMVHDPISLFLGKTYEDSMLIPLNTMVDRTIKGEDIPVEEGYYKYQGIVTINKNQLQAHLLIDDTDKKILKPEEWNGDYTLIEK